MSDTSEAPEIPQIYLITPPHFELHGFTKQLSDILDNVEVACLRLSMGSQDEHEISKAADSLRDLAHTRDIPVILDTHIQLVAQLGLDGIHLRDGAKSVRASRKELGADAVIGTYCGPSRHDGMSAGEHGADYIAFGPNSHTALGDGSMAELETFEWWSQMIELPVVAEGALTTEAVERLAPFTDFFAIGTEIWTKDDPLSALKALVAPLGR